jgi:hypothetical protein
VETGGVDRRLSGSWKEGIATNGIRQKDKGLVLTTSFLMPKTEVAMPQHSLMFQRGKRR